MIDRIDPAVQNTERFPRLAGLTVARKTCDKKEIIMEGPAISRRRLLLATMAAGLAGCGESPLGTTVLEAYRLTVSGHPSVPIERANIAKIPYASMAAKIGKGPRSILILWQDNSGEELWLSADNSALVLRRGRVIRTAGLPELLRGTDTYVPDPVGLGLHEVENRYPFVRTIDLETSNRESIALDSRFELVGPVEIEIADLRFETILLRENCRARTANWSFTNLFWVDPADGFVWKSVQHIARGFPPIEIEILKPPA